MEIASSVYVSEKKKILEKMKCGSEIIITMASWSLIRCTKMCGVDHKAIIDHVVSFICLSIQ